MNIIKSILLGIAAIGSFFGIGSSKLPDAPVPVPAAQVRTFGDTFNPARGKTYNLQSSIGTTNTTIPLSSFKEPISGTPFTMALLNSTTAYGTLDPQQPSRAELISFTGITQNSNGTALLTGVTRGLSGTYPYAASSTFKLSHAGQSIFILSDAPQVFNQYAAKINNETITGQWNFSVNPIAATATTSNQLVTLGQVNGIAIQGAATSTESTGGIVQLGTLAQQASSFNGGASLPTVLQTKNSTSTCQVVGSYNIVASTTTGKLDRGCFDQTLNYTLSGLNQFTASSTFSATTTFAATTTRPIVLDTVAYAFPNAQGAASSTLINNGSGTLSWSVPIQSYVGAPAQITAITTTQNVDTVYTPGFAAKNITIYYALQGVDGGSQLFSFGNATYNGTAVVSNFVLKNNAATNSLSSGVPGVIASAPSAGGATGNNNTVTLTITSVTSTQFTVRSAFVVTGAQSGQAQFYVVATQ